jgi:hypothetical protein
MDIRSLTPTICRLMGLNLPLSSLSDVQNGLVEAVKKRGIDAITRCLVFAPDAIGRTIHDLYPNYFTEMEKAVIHHEYLDSIYPPKTPVCFASMFSGTTPEVHGIRRYERPVLTIDTLFDTLSRSRKRTAIIAVRNSSMDLIFRNRNIDYYSENYDGAVIEKTLTLLEEDKYDFMAVYNQEYDDCLHKTAPYSPECLAALERHNVNFLKLHDTLKRVWKHENWVLVYAPDHGAHFSPTDRLGTHGENIPEDMKLIHYYSFARKSS